jgi:hypothetical protein
MLGSFYEGNSVDLPALEYLQNAAYFAGWALPSFEEPAEAVSILLPGRIIPLTIKNGNILPLQITNNLKENTVSPVFDAVKRQGTVNYPVLAIAFKNGKRQFLSGFDEGGNSTMVRMIPLKEKYSNEKFMIPFGFIDIFPADSSTRTIADCRKFSIYSQSDAEYNFKFSLPFIFSTMNADAIEIKLNYINDGGNVEIIPYLVKREKKGAQMVLFDKISEKIAGVKDKNGRYIFTKDSLASFIEPSGTGYITLLAKIKNKSLPIGQEIRANQWSVSEFSVSVSGRKVNIQANNLSADKRHYLP